VGGARGGGSEGVGGDEGSLGSHVTKDGGIDRADASQPRGRQTHRVHMYIHIQE